jgi:hypothetical protein
MHFILTTRFLSSDVKSTYGTQFPLRERQKQSTIEKLRKLQHEFGDPDEVEEESSIVFSPNASLSGSRPNTGGF